MSDRCFVCNGRGEVHEHYCTQPVTREGCIDDFVDLAEEKASRKLLDTYPRAGMFSFACGWWSARDYWRQRENVEALLEAANAVLRDPEDADAQMLLAEAVEAHEGASEKQKGTSTTGSVPFADQDKA